ncbi:MAG: hypothetical protein ACRENG_18645 [bacterium]
MSTPALTLGRALAVLEAERNAVPPGNSPPFPPSDCDYLQTLRERLQALRQTEQSRMMFAFIPAHDCETEKSYLADNVDFFLMCFLIKPQAEDGGNDCQRLFMHLNDCFLCFDEFSLVTRDYFQMTQELENAPQTKRTN